MKRVGNLMQEISSLDNLYLAYHKASLGKSTRCQVHDFGESLEFNLRSLRDEIQTGTLELGNYHYFTITDPKERLICAASFKERVLHHAIMNVCGKYIDSTLIDTSYATRKGKGVYAALDKAVYSMRHYESSVKLDVRKYYDSIVHDILIDRLWRIFKDRDLMRLLERIIRSYHVEEGRGLPIGNLTSQYFANLYLSDFDHKAKQYWKVPVYIRYMDDILLIGNDRDMLKSSVGQMCRYVNETLFLNFKPPIIRNCVQGQTFLGYKVFPWHLELSGRSKRRFRTKLRKYQKCLDNGIWSERKYQEHLLPLLSFTFHAESRMFREDCIAKMR